MNMAAFVAAGFVALLSTILVFNLGTTKFLDGSCERLGSYLRQNIVGQELALSQLMAAVCYHLDAPEHNKPLIMSVHGPPGVGKSFTHMLMAKALYNYNPESVTDCPGSGCMGYKVIYGLDFQASNREEQLAATKEALLSHVRSVKDPLIVFEEYDKLDCVARAWLRRLLEHTKDADATGSLSRAIILLESNLGFTELEHMLSEARGDETKVTAEAAEKALRDALFSSWRSRSSDTSHMHTLAVGPGATTELVAEDQTQRSTSFTTHSAWACEESFVDTLRFTSLVDFFLPYLPLQRKHVEQVVGLGLKRMAERLLQTKHVVLVWDDRVTSFFAGKVDFDGPYPLEGAKQVQTVLTRYVAPAIRKCPSFDKGLASKVTSVLPFQANKAVSHPNNELRLHIEKGQLVAIYPEPK